MKKFKLSTGQISLVDNDIYDKINGEKWYKNKCGYAGRDLHKEKKRLLLHREVMGLKKRMEKLLTILMVIRLIINEKI